MSAPISQATAHRIWMAHREIQEGRKLLTQIALQWAYAWNIETHGERI
jgi:hypothetical protein